MNNAFDQLVGKKTPEQRREWMEPVKRHGTAKAFAPKPIKHPQATVISAHIPMSELCMCGRRYGMHKVKTFECPNQEWRPGNGQPQWLALTFERAA